MKILIVGDQHFRHELPYASAFEDGRQKEWRATLDKIIELGQSVDAVVLLGDNLDKRHNHSTVVKDFISFLKSFPAKTPVHIMAGNHERYGKETALDFLEKLGHPNWSVHTNMVVEPVIPGGDTTACFVPYVTPAMLGAKDLEEGKTKIMESMGKADLAFVHLALSGKKTDQFNEIVLPLEEMSNRFVFTFGGHVHKAELLADNVLVAGSVFTHDMGEEGKSVFIYDTDLKTYEEHKLPVRGIYKLLVSSADTRTSDIPDHSIVKCIVTDTQVDIDKLRQDVLSRFDAFVVVEQYPNTREKVMFEGGALDLSFENVLKVYADVKGLSYTDLKEAWDLVK